MVNLNINSIQNNAVNSIEDNKVNEFEKYVNSLNDEDRNNLMKELDIDQDERLKQAVKDFEAIFINIMLKSMRNTIDESSLTEKSYGREIYEQMSDQKLSEDIANGGGFGLAQD